MYHIFQGIRKHEKSLETLVRQGFECGEGGI